MIQVEVIISNTPTILAAGPLGKHKWMKPHRKQGVLSYWCLTSKKHRQWKNGDIEMFFFNLSSGYFMLYLITIWLQEVTYI